MAIVKTINEQQFIDAFIDAGHWNSFSRDALIMLYEHLEELSDDTGEDMELDVMAICGDYAQRHLDDVREALELDENADEDEILEALEYHTTVVGIIDDTVVYMDY